MGHLTSKNDPARLWEGLYVFPDSFYKLGGASYLEASAGVENIFKFLRIDYVWHLNYHENPGVQKKWNTVYVYDALHILMRIVHSQRALLLSLFPYLHFTPRPAMLRRPTMPFPARG